MGALTVGRRFLFCSSVGSFCGPGDGDLATFSGGDEDPAGEPAVCRAPCGGERLPLLVSLPVLGDESGWYSNLESRSNSGLPSLLSLPLTRQGFLCRSRLLVSGDVRVTSPPVFVMCATRAVVEVLQPSTLIGRSIGNDDVLPESRAFNCGDV